MGGQSCFNSHTACEVWEGVGHLVLIRIQPYLDYGEHTLSPILPALVIRGGNLATSQMRRHCMPNKKHKVGKLDIGKRTE